MVVPNDRNGAVDPVALSVLRTGAGTEVVWTRVAGAVYYNVIRGDLENLRDAGPVIDLGPVHCIEARSVDTSTVGHEDTGVPQAGGACFYLVEYSDGTSSSYGIESASKQSAPASGACH